MCRFFVDRPIVAIVIAILTVILGLVALVGLPVAQFPSIIPPHPDPDHLHGRRRRSPSSSRWPRRIEQQMNGVDKMLYMQSTNANDGTMTLIVTFDVETEVNIDQVNAQNRVSQAQPNLPAGREPVRPHLPQHRRAAAADLRRLLAERAPTTPCSSATTRSSTSTTRSTACRAWARSSTSASSEYAMRIWVKPDKLAQAGPDRARPACARCSSRARSTPPAASAREPAPPGQQLTYTVRAQGRLVTAEEFGERGGAPRPARARWCACKDVARIELGALTYNQSSRFNGRPAALVAVFQAPGANALAGGERREGGDGRASRRASRATWTTQVGLDTTRPVTEGITRDRDHAGGGDGPGHPGRVPVPAELAGHAHPAHRGAGVADRHVRVLPAASASRSTRCPCSALVLAIGLVVDDAIVVVEAVEHHIEEGMSAARRHAQGDVRGLGPGGRHRAGAVRRSSSPSRLMGGIQGRLNKQFAGHHRDLGADLRLQRADASRPRSRRMLLRPRQRVARPARPLLRRLQPLVRARDRTATWRSRSASSARPASASPSWPASRCSPAGLGRKLPTGFIPDEDQGFLLMNVQLPDAASLQRTHEVTRKIEGMLKDTEGRRGLCRPSTASAFSPAPRRPTQAFFFVSLDALGRAARRGTLGRDPGRASTGRCARRCRGGRVRVRAARHSRHRHRRRLLVLAAGPQRRHRRVPEPEPAEVPGGGAQAPRAGERQRAVPRRGAAGVRRRRPGQGAEAGRRRRRRLPDAAGLPRRPLRQPVQPLRPAVARVPAGRGRGPPHPRGHRPFYVRNGDGDMVPLSTVVSTTARCSAPSTRSASTCSAPRRSPGSRRRATAPGRRWPPWRKWRRRCCRSRWATTGATSPTRRRRPRAAAASCSGSRSASCS